MTGGFTAADWLENRAAAFDLDADRQEQPRPGDGVFPSSKLSAEQRRVVADVLRDCARDFREAS